jgi:ubiquinone/menaquinone biosynthesis methyltransferase
MFDKSEQVYNIFSAVADKYDLMNNLMSFGSHHLWKQHLCNLMTNKHANLLDVAGGTGDVGLKFYQQAKSNNGNPKVTICDINENMLRQGQKKAAAKNIFDINFVVGDAQNLPFDNSFFDYYTISFGIRNVNDPMAAIIEASRVLRAGGEFFCLEFAPVTTGMLKEAYDFYSQHIIPKIGHFVTGRQDAYEYLVDSIRKFPSQEVFVEMMAGAGLENISYKNFAGGIAVLYRGYKPLDDNYA